MGRAGTGFICLLNARTATPFGKKAHTVKADSTVRLSPGGSQLVAGRYVYPAMTYTGKPPDEAFQEAPYEMAPDEEALIGYYHGGGDVLLVREHQGELELLYELEKMIGILRKATALPW